LEFAAIAVLTVVASAPVLAQSNPLVGTWKLNLEKSKFNPGPAPMSLRRTVEAQGDGAKYAVDERATQQHIQVKMVGAAATSPSGLEASLWNLCPRVVRNTSD